HVVNPSWRFLGALPSCTVTGVMSSRQVALPGRNYLGPKNSPSRFPFRPPLSLTFPFRVQSSSSASTYSGSVLGASGNLGAGQGSYKGLGTRRGRNLRKFNFPHFHSRPDRKSTRLNSSHRTISYAVF